MTEARSDTGSGSAPGSEPDTAKSEESKPASAAVSPDTEQPAAKPAVLADNLVDEPTDDELSHDELSHDELSYADAFPPDPEPAGAPSSGLHQPRRALIAAGEVVAVVALALVAVWAWNRGITKLAYPLDGREPLISTRYHGNWLGTAVGCVTIAAVLLLDAVRQGVLAVRTRPGKAADADV